MVFGLVGLMLHGLRSCMLWSSGLGVLRSLDFRVLTLEYCGMSGFMFLAFQGLRFLWSQTLSFYGLGV